MANMSGNLRVVNASPSPPPREAMHEHDSFPSSPVLMSHPAPYSSYSAIEHMSLPCSPVQVSMFDPAEELREERFTDPATALGSGKDPDEDDSFNLKPPPPTLAPFGLEYLASRFFSVDHLDEILRDYTLALRFTNFLQKYRAGYSATLKQYVEAKKAMAAVEYANALASQVSHSPGCPPLVAAVLDDRFDARTKRMVEELVEEALPAYLTYRLVLLVTDTLVKEITGISSPIMHHLIPGLAEVYCISDPSMLENPVVYASSEFYKISQYAKEHVLGRNCRFMQGPKTSASSIRRIVEALTRGEELSELVLNYRRDGSPFMNLLMVAPLYDNKGAVRYFLGCQIDVSSLLEGGRGLESFANLLSRDLSGGLHGGTTARDSKQILDYFGQLLTDEEADVIKNRTRRTSFSTQHRKFITRSFTNLLNMNNRCRNSRVLLGMDEIVDDQPLWPNADAGHIRRIPVVYENYLLVRPSPSLRITFTSPALRIPGLLQKKLLDCIGGPANVREGLENALSLGICVTAKVKWMSSGLEAEGGKVRWIHCTPLFGSDDRVGVWMVVIVKNEQVEESLRASGFSSGATSPSELHQAQGAARFSTNKLYNDYLRREGGGFAGNSRPLSPFTQQTTWSMRERLEADEHFRDF